MLEELKKEGFSHINPPIPVWFAAEGDAIRGYILARQFDRNEEPFYIVQLTQDWQPQADDDEHVLVAGSHVAVFETPTIASCQRLLPHYQVVPTPTGNVEMAAYAFEVVMTGTEQSALGYPDGIEVHAKRINGTAAAPKIGDRPAAFTFPMMTKRALLQFQDTTRAVVEGVADQAGASSDLPSADAPPNGA